MQKSFKTILDQLFQKFLQDDTRIETFHKLLWNETKIQHCDKLANRFQNLTLLKIMKIDSKINDFKNCWRMRTHLNISRKAPNVIKNEHFINTCKTCPKQEFEIIAKLGQNQKIHELLGIGFKIKRFRKACRLCLKPRFQKIKLNCLKFY